MFVLFLSFSHVCSARGELVDRIVAVVNDEVILLSELNEATTAYEKQIRAMNYDPEREKELLYKMRQDFLDQMIDETLTDQQVKHFGIKVDPEDVDAAIERVKQTNYLTDEDLREALKLKGQTMEAYRKDIEEQVLRIRLLNIEVRSKIVITDDEIRKYYEDHKEKYAGQPVIHLKNIVMPFSGTDEEGKKAVKQKMEDVLRQIRGGAAFEEMAKKILPVSQCPRRRGVGRISAPGPGPFHPKGDSWP